MMMDASSTSSHLDDETSLPDQDVKKVIVAEPPKMPVFCEVLAKSWFFETYGPPCDGPRTDIAC